MANNDNPWVDSPDEKEATSSTGGARQELVYFKAAQGKNVIRVVGAYKWYNEYWLPKVKRTVVAGPLKDCPIYNNPLKQKMCDEAKALRDAGKEEEAKALYRKAFAAYNPRIKYVINIIDRKDGTIKLWKFSRTLKEKITNIAEENGDPNNYDLVLIRKGTTKEDTEYDVLASTRSTALTEQEKQLKTYNLAQIFKPTPLAKVQSYLDGKIPDKGTTKPVEPTEPANAVPGFGADNSGLTDDELAELGDLGDLFDK
jgi:hypothetical protein